MTKDMFNSIPYVLGIIIDVDEEYVERCDKNGDYKPEYRITYEYMDKSSLITVSDWWSHEIDEPCIPQVSNIVLCFNGLCCILKEICQSQNDIIPKNDDIVPNIIPKELLKWVYFSNNEFCHKQEMPDCLNKLFEKIKNDIERAIKQKKDYLFNIALQYNGEE